MESLGAAKVIHSKAIASGYSASKADKKRIKTKDEIAEIQIRCENALQNPGWVELGGVD